MSERMQSSSGNPSDARTPWWKFGHVWLVLAGPAIVVVAGFVTFYIAATTSDQLVDEDYYRKGVELSRPASQPSASLAPSLAARNHAQTGAPSSAAKAATP